MTDLKESLQYAVELALDEEKTVKVNEKVYYDRNKYDLTELDKKKYAETLTVNTLQGIIDFIAGVFTGNWSRAWRGVVNIFGGIMSGLGAIMKAPLNAVIGIINSAISAINSIHVDIPDWVPGLGGRSFGTHIGKIPYLAKGGIVDQPTLAMVGEAGKEAVMPLEHNTGWIDNLAGQVASKINGNSTGGSKQPVQINIYQNGVLTTTKVIDDINDMTRANGGICPINM